MLVYISYSRLDTNFVDRLSADLLAAGINAWVDRRKLEGGMDWASELEKAIDGTEVFLVVISEQSVKSAWVRNEISYALSKKKIVIPLLLAEPESLPLFLLTVQWIDFRNGYQNALQALLKALPLSVRANQPLPIGKPQSKGYFFISYAEEDSGFVTSMKDFLRERRYGFWDYQESERDYDTQMFIELEKRIEQAAAVFSILSPDWKLSKWAPKEYLFATEVGIPTFLLMARSMGPTLVTAGVTYIDFTNAPNKGFEKLDQELRRKKLI